jgi:hypothetical protein
MNQATAEETRTVDHDLAHFKQVRHGFDGEVHVGEFIVFTPEDFDWRVTDVHEWQREMMCTLVGDAKAHVTEHLVLLASERWAYGTFSRNSDGTFDNGPHAHSDLKVAWHYKGCRNAEQKRKREREAKRAMESLRVSAMHTPGDKLDACERFNERVREIIERCNREYTKTWVRVITEGSREWVLNHEGDDAHASKVEVYNKDKEREQRLSATVSELRSQLTELRNRQHKRFNALAQQRMIDEGWVDNDELSLPPEVVTLASEKLGGSDRDIDPFDD